MNRTLLVTGAAGFIGANFCHYWSAQYPQDTLIGYDALTYAGNRANLAALENSPRFRFVHADIADTARVIALLREQGVDTIVHFAAESHVDRSIEGPDAFILTNVVGTHSLLKAAREVWLGEGRAHRFHHVSTDEVFGSLTPDAPAFAETLAYAPNSPYSASKAASDYLVRAYHHTYGLQVTTSNCSNNYGPWHFPEKLIPLCILNLLLGQDLPLYGDGLNVRDWLYVEDHCRGIERILQDGRVGETYNIGGNNERTNIEILEALCEQVDQAFARDPQLARRFGQARAARGAASRESIRYVRDRPGHDRRYAIDARKIREELGFEPREDFASGLRRTLDWYLANEPWWRAILARADQGL